MLARSLVKVAMALGLVATSVLGYAVSASAKQIYMPTVSHEMALWHTAALNGDSNAAAALNASNGGPKSVQPPAPPCPESGQLPSPLSNCGLPEFPAAGTPYPGNMAYWGGPVEAHPHVYLIFFGWGEKGAFPANEPCSAESIVEGTIKTSLPCDPQHAGKYMADWVHQLGGTQWAGTSTQYYETKTDSANNPYNQYISNDSNVLKGIWVDDANPTSAKITYTDMATEAQRAAAHFHVSNLTDANFVIAQPANFSDPLAASDGYCAFHDYTLPNIEGGIYNKVEPGIAYTNMPYVLDINSGGFNECGENLVNSDARGMLDGFSIVLGHEIEETITDPGAEDLVTDSSGNQTIYGGWYDALDANENGDKCAWVGDNLAGGLGSPDPNVLPIPGAVGDIKGNAGDRFAVQSLWSNQAAEGLGYCAGAGTDLPQPVPPL